MLLLEVINVSLLEHLGSYQCIFGCLPPAAMFLMAEKDPEYIVQCEFERFLSVTNFKLVFNM